MLDGELHYCKLRLLVKYVVTVRYLRMYIYAEKVRLVVVNLPKFGKNLFLKNNKEQNSAFVSKSFKGTICDKSTRFRKQKMRSSLPRYTRNYQNFYWFS